MGELPVYSLKLEKGDGPLRTLHRDLLLPCGFLSQTEEERPERGSKPKRPQTRQSTVQPEDNNWVQEDDEEICYQFEPSQGTREEALPSESHLSEIPTGTLHSPGTPIRETTNESSLCLPEKEKETDSYLPDLEYGNTTEEESEPLFSGRSDSKSKDSNSDLPLSMPDTPADLPDLQEGSSEQTMDQGAVGIELRNQLKVHLETVQKSDSEISQPIRRSERNRQPSRRFHYPELGNPLVTVVKSLFQGLSAAFSDSLNADDRDWWSQSQAYEITTPILG
ncbi:hypothetical protein N1851_025930 [Merluccius polli]|uniref:Uncharacterized protein n=1 Tax=Merluccius polli TaxID=89951 RepID=A0AA47MCQ6_MERPO|nr:hypothetical protein N1851_025930 [Merluccius polli]